jgi:pimeloyl-ACP methyl ester carboxylesterase
LTESDFQQAFADAAQFGKECSSSIGLPTGAGPHMTTAVVVRDLISIVDAFSRTKEGKSVKTPTLLNYWGFSYGSFIGETFASVFPDRVGRVVLDGIVDPEQYVTVGFGSKGLVSTDEAFSTFFVFCSSAGPQNCSFWESTPDAVYDRFERSVSRLNVQNAEAHQWLNSSSINAALFLLRKLLFPTTYLPIVYFSQLADALMELESALQAGMIDPWVTAIQASLPAAPLEWGAGIYCSDANGFSYNMTYNDLRHWISSLEKESVIGGSNCGLDRIQCTGWSIRGSEVYSGELFAAENKLSALHHHPSSRLYSTNISPGPFGGSPKNPILFVSNTLDPATPLPK